jgi:hypothetical protein
MRSRIFDASGHRSSSMFTSRCPRCGGELQFNRHVGHAGERCVRSFASHLGGRGCAAHKPIARRLNFQDARPALERPLLGRRSRPFIGMRVLSSGRTGTNRPALAGPNSDLRCSGGPMAVFLLGAVVRVTWRPSTPGHEETGVNWIPSPQSCRSSANTAT